MYRNQDEMPKLWNDIISILVISILVIAFGFLVSLIWTGNRNYPTIDNVDKPQTTIVIEIFSYYTITTVNNVVDEIRVDDTYYDISCDGNTPDDNGHNCILVGTSIPPFLDAARMGRIPLTTK